MGEKFSTRLGFLLITAGCAIGLGNVWRFPYVIGEYGGAVVLLFYLMFLALIGIPLAVMELSVGRASRRSAATSFSALSNDKTVSKIQPVIAIAGNYLLMMFYTTVCGWVLAYLWKTCSGSFVGMESGEIASVFSALQGNTLEMCGWMLASIAIGLFVCALGLEKGVEKVTKVMMVMLFVLMILLAVHCVRLPNAEKGLAFYLLPDFSRLQEHGWGTVLSAAMGQALFTLSVGIGSLSVFGGYIGREHRLLGEAARITAMDTFIALVSGVIVFCACFSFGVDVGQGPGLLFVTMPNVFEKMASGRIWGTLFFLCMSFAALSTVIAVFENIIRFWMDLKGVSRRCAVAINAVLLPLLSLPCVLGFTVWKSVQPLGAGSNILDLEDLLVSNTLLPLGCLCFLWLCVSKRGWGYSKFLEEANAGKGVKFPKGVYFYLKFILPILLGVVLLLGYLPLLSK